MSGAYTAALVALVAAILAALASTSAYIVRVGSFDAAGPTRVDGTEFVGRSFIRRDVYFPAIDGQLLHGWLFRPAASQKSFPIVVMASGLGAQIDFGMDKYAEIFAGEYGMAALLFDYRNFGSSEGKVRNLVDPWMHLDDWRSAVEYASRSELADPGGKVALWGSSLSGGHVLVLASELKDRVSAVVSQSPHLDGRENRKKNIRPPPIGRGLLDVLRISLVALQDIIRDKLGLAPAYIPIVGELGSISIMTLSPGELSNYFRKHPESRGGGWQNMAPARIVLRIGSYSPIDFVPEITSSVLFVAAGKDTLCPPEFVQKAASLTKSSSEVMVLNAGHFETYYDEHFANATARMGRFLREHL